MASWVRKIAPAAPFVLGTGVALLLARPDLPLAAGAFIVGLTTICLGFELYLRFKELLLLVAGCIAAAAACATLHYAVRVNQLDDSGRVQLESIADAPRHPGAGRLGFPPAIPREGLGGEVNGRRSIYRQTQEQWHAVAVPLVPRDWTRREPVPAWLVCYEEGPYSNCKQPFSAPITRAFIAPQRGRTDLRTAIDKAIQQHQLHEAHGAPMLVASTDAEEDVETLRLWIWGAPLAGFGVWLAGRRIFVSGGSRPNTGAREGL